jgi:hypothetical protein
MKCRKRIIGSILTDFLKILQLQHAPTAFTAFSAIATNEFNRPLRPLRTDEPMELLGDLACLPGLELQ